MATRWFLVDTDEGVLDEAEKKGILMWRYGFYTSKKIGNIYMILQGNDGIGHNYYIIKDVDMEKEGFDWALKKWDSRESKID